MFLSLIVSKDQIRAGSKKKQVLVTFTCSIHWIFKNQTQDNILFALNERDYGIIFKLTFFWICLFSWFALLSRFDFDHLSCLLALTKTITDENDFFISVHVLTKDYTTYSIFSKRYIKSHLIIEFHLVFRAFVAILQFMTNWFPFQPTQKNEIWVMQKYCVKDFEQQKIL